MKPKYIPARSGGLFIRTDECLQWTCLMCGYTFTTKCNDAKEQVSE